jgi:hypothetical protein
MEVVVVGIGVGKTGGEMISYWQFVTFNLISSEYAKTPFELSALILNLKVRTCSLITGIETEIEVSVRIEVKVIGVESVLTRSLAVPPTTISIEMLERGH